MPILLWGAGAVATTFFGWNALKEADQAAKSLTMLLIFGTVGYFLLLNPKILKLKG